MSNDQGTVHGAARTKIERFEQLDVWNKAHVLVLDVYRTTKAFPDEEKFGIVSQMRRAAVSVPANIAEGFKRRGSHDKSRFYNISQSSLEELRYYCILCRDLDYPIDYASLLKQTDDVGRMLTRLIQAVTGQPR